MPKELISVEIKKNPYEIKIPRNKYKHKKEHFNLYEFKSLKKIPT